MGWEEGGERGWGGRKEERDEVGKEEEHGVEGRSKGMRWEKGDGVGGRRKGMRWVVVIAVGIFFALPSLEELWVGCGTGKKLQRHSNS